MKVLWITNIVFPEARHYLTNKVSDWCQSGGWMLGAAESLVCNKEMQLAIASPSVLVKKLEVIKGKDIEYFVFPLGRGNTHINSEYKQYWRDIVDLFHPDVIHIYGTEYSHGLAYVDVYGSNNVVVSIQGMTSAYRYYYSGLTKSTIRKNLTFRALFKGNILKAYRCFKARSVYEKQLLLKTQHVIGRTTWDRAQTWAINPKLEYHLCNEILRKEFYVGRWDYDHCKKHSIFISQANYPIKGFHMLLQALPLILRHYPNTTVRIAGDDIVHHSSFIDRLKASDYSKIMRRMIRNNNLNDKIFFTGPLDAAQMKQEYLNANVFVCPSSIENSPNSIGEAQLLGVPIIASYVGGIPDMMKEEENCLYRFEDVEMLAWKICTAFEKTKEYDNRLARQRAHERHDSQVNTKRLIEIYNSIISL